MLTWPCPSSQSVCLPEGIVYSQQNLAQNYHSSKLFKPKFESDLVYCSDLVVFPKIMANQIWNLARFLRGILGIYFGGSGFTLALL